MALHWVLGRAGRMDEAASVRHDVSRADLREALRGAGLVDSAAATQVTLEPSGKINALHGGRGPPDAGGNDRRASAGDLSA